MIDTDKIREKYKGANDVEHRSPTAILDIRALCDELDRMRADRDSWRRVADQTRDEAEQLRAVRDDFLRERGGTPARRSER